MPVNPNAAIEITAFRWVPEFAQGVVRDLRVRWALEEVGLDYRVRLLGQERPPEYLLRAAVRPGARASATARSRFSKAARSSNISARRAKRCCRAIRRARFRAIQWTYAALNSVEPAILNLLLIDVFYAGEEWAKLRRPGAEDFARLKLKRVSDWLGDKEWLEGDRFTIGDLIMITTLRFLRHTDMVAEFPNLAALSETRRSAARIPARAGRPARGVPRAPTGRSSSMTYIEGFIVPVPEANKDAYRKHATEFAPMVQEFGVAPHGRSLGQRRARRQGHRLPQGGRCQARREDRLLLVRISVDSRIATPPTRR